MNPSQPPPKVPSQGYFQLSPASRANGPHAYRPFASSKRKRVWKIMKRSWELWVVCTLVGRPCCRCLTSRRWMLLVAKAVPVSRWKGFQPSRFLSSPSLVVGFLTSEIQPQRSLPNFLHICTHKGVHAHTHAQCSHYSTKWALGVEIQRSGKSQKDHGSGPS